MRSKDPLSLCVSRRSGCVVARKSVCCPQRAIAILYSERVIVEKTHNPSKIRGSSHGLQLPVLTDLQLETCLRILVELNSNISNMCVLLYRMLVLLTWIKTWGAPFVHRHSPILHPLPPHLGERYCPHIRPGSFQDECLHFIIQHVESLPMSITDQSWSGFGLRIPSRMSPLPYVCYSLPQAPIVPCASKMTVFIRITHVNSYMYSPCLGHHKERTHDSTQISPGQERN